MVSTRQCSTKFSVGETVLCYEPDESKAKVLYESKVLEVDFTKDEKGKKVPEYFVHFSGWNKSWDRWVLEDQVLECSEMNKLKMKRLHEEAVNRLKSKKKKKGLLSILDDVSQSSGEACLTPPQQPPTPTCSSPLIPCIEIEIPSSLKLKLEDDCYFIKRKKKLVRLPRSPNIIDILKEYIDYFTELTNQNVPEVQSSVQIVKEVMDGLRIYFDFTLPSLLLYNFERDQYEQVIKSYENKEKKKNGENQKEQKEESRNVEEEMDTKDIKSSLPEIKQERSDTMKLRKSASRQESLSEQGKQDDKASDRVLRRRSKRQKTVSVPTHSVSTSGSSTFSSSGGERDESLNISSEINEEHTEKGGKKKLVHESPSKVDGNSTKPVPKETTTTTTVLSEPSTTGVYVSSFRTAPSKIYGAEHLLRLFVKLPSLLAKTTVQENRLSLLLQHLTDFLKFLASRTDVFFSEDVYQDVIL